MVVIATVYLPAFLNSLYDIMIIAYETAVGILTILFSLPSLHRT